MKVLVLLFIFGACAQTPKVVYKFKKRSVKSWSAKKRECHGHYLNTFGLKPSEAVEICKEELER